MRHHTDETVLVHICEVCGKTENISTREAYDDGWDYPPGIGFFGVVSPRTCGNCGIDKTVYWRILQNNMKMPTDLSEAEKATLTRIVNEPESIYPEEPADGA